MVAVVDDDGEAEGSFSIFTTKSILAAFSFDNGGSGGEGMGYLSRFLCGYCLLMMVCYLFY